MQDGKGKKPETKVADRPPTHAEDPIRTVGEAAAQLNRTRRTIYNWCESGVLKPGRHPTSKRIIGIRQSQIDQCLKLFPIGGDNTDG